MPTSKNAKTTLYSKVRYLWQQASRRTESENKEQLQNILGQKVINKILCRYLLTVAGKDM